MHLVIKEGERVNRYLERIKKKRRENSDPLEGGMDLAFLLMFGLVLMLAMRYETQRCPLILRNLPSSWSKGNTSTSPLNENRLIIDISTEKEGKNNVIKNVKIEGILRVQDKSTTFFSKKLTYTQLQRINEKGGNKVLFTPLVKAIEGLRSIPKWAVLEIVPDSPFVVVNSVLDSISRVNQDKNLNITVIYPSYRRK